MDQSEIVGLPGFVFAILGMFGLALSIVFFVVLYQRRLLNNQKKMDEERLAHQQGLLKAALEAQEAERKRIGRDLHDDIGSMIATARLFVQQTQSQNPQNASLMNQADDILIETVKSLHVITQDLVPTILHQLGLVEAIDALCGTIRQNSALEIHFQAEEGLSIAPQTALHLYRIVQELFNNSLKHAEASRIEILLRRTPSHLLLGFADNGKGIHAPSSAPSSGLGLKNIESRLSLLAGTMEISAEQGTRFEIQIPLTQLRQTQSKAPS
ncbi:MAG: ATP-binding protein [Bacteroidota bacterium]